MRIEKEFIKAIQKASTPKTSAYDTSATVTRIEGSTAWVHIDGGADETPVERTIDCAVGDTVRIRLSGGAGYVIGNNTAPPTDDAVAIIARDTAYGADKKAQIAGQAAQDAIDKAVIAGEAAADAQASATAAGQAASAAQASADNASEYASRALGNLTTVQSVAETLTWITQHGAMTLTTDTTLDPTHVYFVVDANGDYVVGSTHYSIVTEPDVDDIGTYYELSIDESLNNYVATHLALTNDGLWIIPDNNGYKILIATGAQGSSYAAGTHIVASNGNIVATFGTETVIKTTDGTELAHFGYALGQGESGTAIAPYYTLGTRKANADVGNYSMAEGLRNEASGELDHVEGIDNTSTAILTHIEGKNNSVYASAETHVEGKNNTIDLRTGGGSVAKGTNHVEGIGNTLPYRGRAIHIEGMDNTARGGSGYHVEGKNNQATSAYISGSHLSGENNICGYSDQAIFGKYNDNKADNLLEIGNGTADNARSNAFEVYSTGKFGTPGMYFSVNSNGEMCVTYEDGT